MVKIIKSIIGFSLKNRYFILSATLCFLIAVMMTALMAAVGLFPAAISHGIGSESSRPLARAVIGGILCAMVFSLLVFR